MKLVIQSSIGIYEGLDQYPLMVPKFIIKGTVNISPVTFGCSSFLGFGLFVRSLRELVCVYSQLGLPETLLGSSEKGWKGRGQSLNVCQD